MDGAHPTPRSDVEQAEPHRNPTCVRYAWRMKLLGTLRLAFPLAAVALLVLAGSAFAASFTTAYRYKTKRFLPESAARARYYSRNALYREFRIERGSLVTYCGGRSRRYASCDVLLAETGTAWCGGTYVYSHPRYIRVIMRMTNEGCGEF